MYTKHKCKWRKDRQLPLTLRGSKEDLQSIRILPHEDASNYLMHPLTVLVSLTYLRVLLCHIEAHRKSLLGEFVGEQCIASLGVWPTLFSSVAHRRFRSAPVLSEHVSSHSFIPTGVWSRVPEDAGDGCCGVLVNVFGLEGRVVRELHHSFSKCCFFFLYSSEKSSCISRAKKEFGTGQGKMQYALEGFREVRSSLSCSLGIPQLLMRCRRESFTFWVCSHRCFGWGVSICGGGYSSVNSCA